MNNKKTLSGLSIAIIFSALVFSILYRFNIYNFTKIIQKQIPVFSNYSINTVIIFVCIFALILSLLFRNDEDNENDVNHNKYHNNDYEDCEVEEYTLPDTSDQSSIHHPQLSYQQETKPIPIVIQPIIKEPIHENNNQKQKIDDIKINRNNRSPKIDRRNNYNKTTHQTHSKKKLYIKNYWNPKNKKKLKIRNYWNRRSWNSR